MDYKASRDKMCNVITAVVLIILSVVALSIFFINREDFTELSRIGIIVIFIALVLISYILAPKSYSLEGNEFRINRPAKNRIIKTEDLAEVRSLDTAELSGMIRTFGNGGLFGYYGKFYNRKLGHMTLYATQRKNFILIKTKSGKKIIISPDDISLMDALQSKVSV